MAKKLKCFKGWKKTKIYETGAGSVRYECVKKPYTIDVNIDAKQGYPGSNMVSIIDGKYGGWVLDTPKHFKSIKQTEAFVKKATILLEKNKTGKRVSFPRD